MSLRERIRRGSGIIEPCLPSPAKAPLPVRSVVLDRRQATGMVACRFRPNPAHGALAKAAPSVKTPKATPVKRKAEEDWS